MSAGAKPASPDSRTGNRRLNPSLAPYLRGIRTPKGMVGLLLLGALSALALLAPLFFSGGYDLQTSAAMLGPTLAHPLGTDEFGRDMLVRIVYGLRTDLALVLLAVPLGGAIGTLLGLTGMISEFVGSGVQRLFDVIIGFPGVIVGISIVTILGVGWRSLFLAVMIQAVPIAGRLARGALLTQRRRDYVIAAETLGVRRSRVMVRHVLPHAVDEIIVAMAVQLVIGINIVAGLSIVGLGIQPPEPSLGALLNNGMRFIYQSPSYVIGPGVVLLMLALSFNLLADALNEEVNAP